MRSIKLVSIILLVTPLIGFAEDANIEKYKQAYVEQVKPILKDKFSAALEKEKDPEATLEFVAKGMADCQVEILKLYPQKYREASINPIVEGGNMTEVTSDVNNMMKQDIESGEISQEELTNIFETASKNFLACTQELEKQL